MAKIAKAPAPFVFPVPVIMATCADSTGRPNIITLSWVSQVCSTPPQVGISIQPIRYSYGLVKKSGEFVLNIPSTTIAREVDFCGVASGKDTDKFKETGLTPLPATHVGAPLIAECPVNIECRVVQSHMLGSHELFIGEILAVHIDEEVIDAEGKVDIAKVDTFAYAQREYWSLKEKIGSYAFTRKG